MIFNKGLFISLKNLVHLLRRGVLRVSFFAIAFTKIRNTVPIGVKEFECSECLGQAKVMRAEWDVRRSVIYIVLFQPRGLSDGNLGTNSTSIDFYRYAVFLLLGWPFVCFVSFYADADDLDFEV